MLDLHDLTVCITIIYVTYKFIGSVLFDYLPVCWAVASVSI